ncbi:MAG: hypothetical protein HY938_10665 [Nitrosomonadales bacterium]|nr:hypothetical protein [Nitrosomonadales bacterium]
MGNKLPTILKKIGKTIRFRYIVATDSESGLQRIKNDFRRIFQQAAPHLKLPF